MIVTCTEYIYIVCKSFNLASFVAILPDSVDVLFSIFYNIRGSRMGTLGTPVVMSSIPDAHPLISQIAVCFRGNFYQIISD